jgi:exodeoxyribonuclease VII large subunit
MAAAGNLPEYSVGDLAFALKRTIEDSYGLLRVRGELSGFKRAASGHIYLALKDDRAVIDAVCWRATAARLAFAPEDGLEVICTGRLTTYPGRSKYQLVIEQMEPAGVGALMALLEERKKRLQAEGLFDEGRKRPLPFLPEVVGVVTSPTGAVIRDILHRLADRFPRRVLVWPVLVQGEGAAEQVAAAIRGFDGMAPGGAVPRPDVLIVARGGGSIEDLWAFNEEVVARAVAGCAIPLISAVGHETDTTLIDHVADRRAPTPTAAAEMAVPVRADLLAGLAHLEGRQTSAMQRSLRELAGRLDGLRRGLPEPTALIGMAAQRLDDLGERLRLRTPAEVLRGRSDRLAQRHARLGELVADRLRRARVELDRASRRLLADPIRGRIELAAPLLAREAARLEAAAGRRLEDAGLRLDQQAKLLESLGPDRVLERGYAIVSARPSGKVLASAAAAAGERDLDLRFHDGGIAVSRAGGRGRAKAEPVRQGTLL